MNQKPPLLYCLAGHLTRQNKPKINCLCASIQEKKGFVDRLYNLWAIKLAFCATQLVQLLQQPVSQAFLLFFPPIRLLFVSGCDRSIHLRE